MNGIEYKYISQYKENEILKVKNSLLKMEKDFKQLKQREKYGMQKLKELEDNVRSFKIPKRYYISNPRNHYEEFRGEIEPRKPKNNFVLKNI